MSASTILGVDIGASGALALIDANGELLQIEDMPVLNDGPAGRRAVNAPLLSAILWRWAPSAAFVESVGSRPGEGAVGAFAFGRSRGVVEGVLGAMDVPVKFLTSPVWKRAIGIPAGKDGAKDAARSEAIRRWPGKAELFKRKLDDGRAEAGLIAVAGLIRSKAGEAV